MDLENTLHKLVCSQIIYADLCEYQQHVNLNNKDLIFEIPLSSLTNKLKDNPLIGDTLKRLSSPSPGPNEKSKVQRIDNQYVLDTLITNIQMIYVKQIKSQETNNLKDFDRSLLNTTLFTIVGTDKRHLESVKIQLTQPIVIKLGFFKNLIYQLHNIVKKLILYDIKNLEKNFHNYSKDIELINSGKFSEEMLLKDDEEFKRIIRTDKNNKEKSKKNINDEIKQLQEKVRREVSNEDKQIVKVNAEKKLPEKNVVIISDDEVDVVEIKTPINDEKEKIVEKYEVDKEYKNDVSRNEVKSEETVNEKEEIEDTTKENETVEMKNKKEVTIEKEKPKQVVVIETDEVSDDDSRISRRSLINDETKRRTRSSSRKSTIDEDKTDEDKSPKKRGRSFKNESSPDLETSPKRSKTSPPNKKFVTVATQLIANISSFKFSSPFLTPVNENDAPNYYSVIYEPSDLKTIRAKVKLGEIKTHQELERELMLMLANSIMYNRSNTEMNKWALEMLKETTKVIDLFAEAERDAQN